MTLTHNFIFLIASVIVAMAAMLVTLEFTTKALDFSSKGRTKNRVYGAISLGLGIWCAQFDGLLALEFPDQTLFNVWPTLMSLSIAFVVSGYVLWIVSTAYQPFVRFSVSTISLVTAIAGSHFVGRMALPAHVVEQPMFYGLLSVAVCMVFVAISLWMMFFSDYCMRMLGRVKLLVGSVLLGLAIILQHYLSLEWTSFDMQAVPLSYQTVSADSIAAGIGLSSVLMLMVAFKFLINRPIVSIAEICLLVFGAEFSIGIVASSFSLLDEEITKSLLHACILAILLIPVWKRMQLDGKNLDKSQRRAETVLASIGDAVLVTDPKGEIEYLNPIAEQLTGWRRENAQGEQLATAFYLWDQHSGQPVEDPIDLCLREKLKNNHIVQAILCNRKRQASPIEITASAIQNGNKNEGNILVFRDVTAKHRAKKQLDHDIEARQILNELLCIRSTEMPLDDLLHKALDIVTSVSWLDTHKGGIFLMDHRQKLLRLTVHKHFRPENQSLCRKIQLGQCLCGRAVSQKQLVFSASIDERHDIRYDGMTPHGTYNVPVILDQKTLGLVVLYLKDNHKKRQQEVEFLENVASALGILIELNSKSEKIKKLAYFDKLTRLANRACLLKNFKKVVVKAKKNNRQFAVIFLDLDRFKAINDTLGHHYGDEILIQVARRLEACVRKDDFVARLGGDEFVIVLSGARQPSASSFESAQKTAQKILDSIRKPFKIDQHDLVIGTSIGIAVYPNDGDKLETLLQNADAAMYYAKEQGRNNFQFYSESMNEAYLHRLGLETALRTAAEKGYLRVHYQPQVDMESNQIVGAEALLRWTDPKMGIIEPSEFIPIAEETDLIVRLGEWVLEQVCIQLNYWKSTEHYQQIKKVAINVSLKEIQKSDFASGVAAVLRRHQIDPARIEFELTESALADDSDTIRQNMRELQAMGVRLALDDFGTGYSSLGRLKDFPVDSIKIDRMFVKDMASKQSDAAIAKAIVAMAHSLSIKVLAEGVETPNQLKHLNRFGCDLFQGYYCAPALTGDDFVKFCHKRESSGKHKIA